MTRKPPTARQLNYLRALANRTGQTFAWPTTMSHASQEIQRLKRTQPSTRQERAIKRLDLSSEQVARQANCDVPINPSEVTGSGLSCRPPERNGSRSGPVRAERLEPRSPPDRREAEATKETAPLSVPFSCGDEQVYRSARVASQEARGARSAFKRAGHGRRGGSVTACVRKGVGW